MKFLLIMAAFTTLLAGSISADSTSVVPARTDTVQYLPVADSALSLQVNNSVSLEKNLIQNPTRALFKSMLVPGWGQFGNRKYVKAGLFMALESWFIGNAIYYGTKASDNMNDFKRADIADTSAASRGQRNYYYGLYMDNRSSRNKFRWYAGIAIFVSMFDAFVDAHLSASPLNQPDRKLSLEVGPDWNGGARATLALRF